MTREEIVGGLQFTVDMFLFDPNTGETYTEPRNDMDKTTIDACKGAIELLEQTRWIPVSERLPKTDNKNSINNYNVLLWVKNKNDPKDEPQVYLGKLKYVDGDDGSGNFWGIKTRPCDWTIWGWSYFYEPEVLAWMPLPEPYKESEDKE